MQIFEERLQKQTLEGGKVQLPREQWEVAAEALGISSIKYYDLKQNRVQNYVFSFDKMLDPKGNTGVYLIYMYVRVLSIMRKANYEGEALEKLLKEENFKISNQSEKELVLTLLKVPEQIELTLSELQLNKITDLLYEVSVKFSEFYTLSKVIGSEEEKSRIILLEAVRRVMEILFHLLGMKPVDRL